MITRINFKELRAQLSFEHILAHYEVVLKGSSGQLSGFCPLPTHQGKSEGKRTPSFSANTVKGIWQCFGCGAKGNLIEFAGRMEGMNPGDPQDFRKIAVLLHRRATEGRRPRQGARDRRASTGEAGDASRRKVIVGAVSHRGSGATLRTQDESRPNQLSRHASAFRGQDGRNASRA